MTRNISSRSCSGVISARWSTLWPHISSQRRLAIVSRRFRMASALFSRSGRTWSRRIWRNRPASHGHNPGHPWMPPYPLYPCGLPRSRRWAQRISNWLPPRCIISARAYQQRDSQLVSFLPFLFSPCKKVYFFDTRNSSPNTSRNSEIFLIKSMEIEVNVCYHVFYL